MSEQNETENPHLELPFLMIITIDYTKIVKIRILKIHLQEFPGGPVVRTPCFHCRGHGFDPWLGN